MQRILLMPNKMKDPECRISRRIVGILCRYGATVAVPEELTAEFSGSGAIPVSEVPSEPELLIAIGGDGTVLSAAKDAIMRNLPLLGVNMGRLGFLAELETDQLDRLECLFTGDYRLTERMTLSVSVDTGEGMNPLPAYPLNDVVFSHDRGDGLAELILSDSEGNRIDYHADGLIFATPSGSTAYSLSAGGPIVDDTVEAICVTPVCPHSFFNRAVIFGRDASLTVENNSPTGKDVIVSIDGSDVLRLPVGGKIRVCRSQHPLRMLTLDRHATLRSVNRKMQMADMKYRKE